MLPSLLLRNLADAEVAVVSWSADSGEPVLRVSKEIGPEVRLLKFRGVGQVCLVPRMTVAVMTCCEPGEGQSAGSALGKDERRYVIEEAWGASHFVVAEAAEYEIIS